MAEAIEGRVAELLDAKNFVHVASVRQNGKPHVVPVWVDHEDGKVVLNTAEGRAWPANVRRNGNAVLNVMNLENPYEYVEIEADLVEDTQEGADEHINAMAKKYLGQDEYPFRQDGEQRVILRLAPTKIRHNNPG
jgi:PPOX class probable F420-dependent enzyme